MLPHNDNANVYVAPVQSLIQNIGTKAQSYPIIHVFSQKKITYSNMTGPM